MELLEAINEHCRVATRWASGGLLFKICSRIKLKFGINLKNFRPQERITRWLYGLTGFGYKKRTFYIH